MSKSHSIITLLLCFLSCTANADGDQYKFSDLCGSSYSKVEGKVNAIAASTFSDKTPNGGGVVITVENISRYIYQQYNYSYAYTPMFRIATMANALGQKVNACYDDKYIYVIQLQQ